MHELHTNQQSISLDIYDQSLDLVWTFLYQQRSLPGSIVAQSCYEVIWLWMQK
jgi:hypothetical protein